MWHKRVRDSFNFQPACQPNYLYSQTQEVGRRTKQREDVWRAVRSVVMVADKYTDKKITLTRELSREGFRLGVE